MVTKRDWVTDRQTRLRQQRQLYHTLARPRSCWAHHLKPSACHLVWTGETDKQTDKLVKKDSIILLLYSNAWWLIFVLIQPLTSNIARAPAKCSYSVTPIHFWRSSPALSIMEGEATPEPKSHSQSTDSVASWDWLARLPVYQHKTWFTNVRLNTRIAISEN